MQLSPPSTSPSDPGSSGLMKRKRPPQLSIPQELTTSSTPQSDGSLPRQLSAGFDPHELSRDDVMVEGRTFALSSKRGKRSKSANEDTFQARTAGRAPPSPLLRCLEDAARVWDCVPPASGSVRLMRKAS